MCSFWMCSNSFYVSEGTATSIHFLKFSSLPSEINRWCYLIKRQSSKDGFSVFSNTALCHHHFKEKGIKKSFSRWKLLPGSWNKYRSKIITQPKNNNLDYLSDLTLRNINRLFVLSFKNGDNDPTRNSFDKYYVSLVQIKDFDTLINNKPFFDQPVKTNKKRMKTLSKCQKMMAAQQEIY